MACVTLDDLIVEIFIDVALEDECAFTSLPHFALESDKHRFDSYLHGRSFVASKIVDYSR